MSLETIRLYNTFLALLTLVALALAAGLVVYRLVKGRHAGDLFGGKALWMAWLVAIVATVGSLIYSDVALFVPCRLCWFQRIAMYPLSVVLLVGAIRKDMAAKFYALPMALIGLAVSVWHYLIQTFPNLEGGACEVVNPCSARYVEVFGFISIPFMAGAGFTLISVLLLLYVRANKS